ALFTVFRLSLFAIAILQISGCGSPEERAQSHYERGKKLLAENERAKATIEFKNALQLKKDHIGAWRALAQIEENNQNWEGLAAILRTIVELDAKDVETRLRLARLMLFGNSPDDALKLASAATDLDTRHAGALALKAAALLKLNDANGATRDARAALELDPANSEALIVLSAERFVHGDLANALEILSREQLSTSGDFGIQLFKMKIYEQMGNLRQVESLLT